MAVTAEPPSSYGAPSYSGGFGGGFGGDNSGQVYRHVYVHAAPDEPQNSQSRVIRVPGGQDKHVSKSETLF